MINTTAARAGSNLASAIPASSDMLARLNHNALFLLFLVLVVEPLRAHAGAPAPGGSPVSSSLFSSQSLHFELNRGQANGPAQFLARGVNYNFLIAPSEAELILGEIVESPVAGSSRDMVRYHGGRIVSPPRTVRMQFLGANPEAPMRGCAEMPGKINYLLGNDPAQWRTGIPTYARVVVGDLYPGINMVYYGNQHQLEYDLLVAPGADPAAITIHFEGIDEISVNRLGELVLK